MTVGSLLGSSSTWSGAEGILSRLSGLRGVVNHEGSKGCSWIVALEVLKRELDISGEL